MLYLDAGISFMALISLSIFFTKKFNINSALTPLVSICATIGYFSFVGVIDQLVVGGCIYFAVCFAFGIYAFLYCKKQRKIGADTETLLTPGFLFFVIVGVVIFGYLAYRQPIFGEWDELSLWGTACKLMKINNRLYTVSEVAWDWIPSQLPGLISLGYFAQFFGDVFAPWKVFFGYDLLYLAMFAGAVAAFDFKKYKIFVPTAIICVLTPFFLTVYTRIIFSSTIYMNSYGDIPSGMMFGGVLAWYFSMRTIGKQKGNGVPNGFFATYIILFAAGLLKDNTFVVQLVAAGIIAVDILFFGIFEGSISKIKNIIGRIVAALMAFLSPIIGYSLWLKYIGYLASLREAAGEVGNTNMPLTQVVIEGFKMLFSPALRSDRFNQVFTDMLAQFFDSKLSMIGSGFAVVIVIVAIFVFTIIFAQDKTHKKRTALAMVLSTGGFIGYYWVLILSYSFIFRQVQAENLESYNRYVQSYYLGWFLLAIVMLAIGAKKSKPFGVLKAVLLGISCVVLLLTAYNVRPQMSILAYPESNFYSWRTVENKANEIKDKIPNDGKIFFVSQNDNGLQFFDYCYELLPYQLEFSFGGGRTGPKEFYDESPYYHYQYTDKNGDTFEMDYEGMQRYLQINDCKYVFIDEIDEIFVSEYKDIFTDKLDSAISGEVTLYKRVDVISDKPRGVLYAPVK